MIFEPTNIEDCEEANGQTTLIASLAQTAVPGSSLLSKFSFKDRAHRYSSIHIRTYMHKTKSNWFLFTVGLTSAELGKLVLKTEIFLPFSKMP